MSSAALPDDPPEQRETSATRPSSSPEASFVPGDRIGPLKVVRAIDATTALATHADHEGGFVVHHWADATRDDARALGTPPEAPRHPCWLPVMPIVGELPGVVFVHRALAGPSLETLLQRVRLTLPQIDGLGRHLIAAVESAHRLDRVIGAVDPSAIWVARQGPAVVPHVVGVGLAEVLPDPARYVLDTVKEPFVAPEVKRGGHLSLAADRYALGVVLHVLATGRQPAPEGLALDDLPERMQRTIAACLDADPVSRPLDVLAVWTRGRPMPTHTWSSDLLDRIGRLGPHLSGASITDAGPRPVEPRVSGPLPALATVGLLALVLTLSAWCSR